eukprot:gene3970-4247_t
MSSSLHLYSSQHQRKYGAYVIIVLLMTAIVVVSFYEPRWIHSGAFVNRQISLLQASQPFEDVLDLRERISEATQKGKRSTALQTISVETEHLEYNGYKFIVVKPEGQRIKSIQNPADLNPIDPLAVENIDKDLIIHDFGINAPSFEYTLVLNKFNTVPDHCLIVSNHYKPQIGLITKEEFAIWSWLTKKIKGIGFYNSNKVAGASQRHKHLQIVPQDSIHKFVLGSQSMVPLDEMILPKIRRGEVKLLSPASSGEKLDDLINTIDLLPFVHGYIALDTSSLNDEVAHIQFAELLEKAYYALLKKVSLDERLLKDCAELQRSFSFKSYQRCEEKGAYNLVLSSNYLFIAPRSKLSYHDNVNGLGFLGIFLGSNDDSLKELRRIGPLNVLREVCVKN